MNLVEKLKSIETELAKTEQKVTTQMNGLSSDGICPICHDTGWKIVYDSDNQPYAEECSCGIRKREIHNNQLQFANIPEVFKDARLCNFKRTVYKLQESQDMIVDVAKAVRYWLQNLESMKERGIGLYIYSWTKGSGKTRLAASIANELMEKHETYAKFTTSIQILQEIKKTWGNDAEGDSALLDSLARVNILIIDDFGAESKKDWVDEKFNSIINGRYVDKKITIFTSNASVDDLKYDDRITNRIKERTLQIPFPEESVRISIAEDLRKELMEGINE